MTIECITNDCPVPAQIIVLEWDAKRGRYMDASLYCQGCLTRFVTYMRFSEVYVRMPNGDTMDVLLDPHLIAQHKAGQLKGYECLDQMPDGAVPVTYVLWQSAVSWNVYDITPPVRTLIMDNWSELHNAKGHIYGDLLAEMWAEHIAPTMRKKSPMRDH